MVSRRVPKSQHPYWTRIIIVFSQFSFSIITLLYIIYYYDYNFIMYVDVCMKSFLATDRPPASKIIRKYGDIIKRHARARANFP